MSVRRHLLIKMALAGSARAKLYRVVIVFNERDHAKKHDIARSLIQEPTVPAPRCE